MRFALLFGAMSLLIGGLLLAAVFLIVQQNLGPLPQEEDILLLRTGDGRWEPMDETPRAQAAYERAVQRVYLRNTLDNVRNLGALALLGTTAIAAATGWWAAGLVLRPARKMTAAARRVALSHDLAERIDYHGPNDEIKELADIFDGMLGRLARVLDGQRRFIANASHELRTPLTVNRTLVDVAVRGPGATAEVRQLGESLLVVNARHERLIDGLLALAEGDQAVLDRTRFDLSDVVEHVVDQAAAEAAERGITMHSAPGSAPTAGDPALVERLVQNLVENAIRHNLRDGAAWVTSRRRGDMVELVVENTGPAVPAYEIEAIFQPFRRLRGDRLNSERGSGLGLSIVRAIASAHDGTVTARPRDEGGLAVTVRLPYEE
ncbi:HAMP domain-containing sensor histidine kinase [Acrocarpospora macrocephala]|uniref:histidine kinase n=2 Tax=Acrocarpospora macrocephala TaxID=150177 RepID=A0A5M3X5M9_9ACTN|nr:sensor protein CutS [Acrocarpospora macrocephala]